MLTNVYAAQEENVQALAFFNQALPLMRQVGDIRNEAATLANLGTLYVTMKQPEQARTCWQQALPLFEKAGSPQAATVRQKLAALDQPPTPPTPPQ
jgi:tetratricopeptide (TPR) repeat protein